MQFYESEFKLMEVLWEVGSISASDACKILEERYGWKRNTSYTMLKKCVDKGYIERTEPHFMCRPLITKKDAQLKNVSEMLDSSFESKQDFFRTFLRKENLSEDEISDLIDIVNKLR